MKSLSKKTKLVFLISVIVLVGGSLLIVLSQLVKNDAPKGMRQVKSFDANGICLALNNPECGYCPGEVKQDKCYVKQGTLDQYP